MGPIDLADTLATMRSDGKAMRVRLVALASVAALAVAACSGSGSGTSNGESSAGGSSATSVGGSAPVETRPTVAPTPVGQGPCPEKLVIQTDWFPEIEHGGTYQLIGAGGTADADTKRYSGPLQERYRGATGIGTVEIRAGGPAIDGPVVDVLTNDAEVYLGFVNTDDAIAARRTDQAVTGVVGTLDISPQMLMWSPTRYAITKFDDLAKTRAKVLHFPGMTYVDYLVAQGFVRADQLDDSYQGDPSTFVQSKGDIIQQGFATNEVFTYENLVEGWRKPVDFFLIHWFGYENYPAMLSVPTAKLAERASCLQALVPELQRAWVDFLNDPEATSGALVEISDTYDTFFKISAGLNERAIRMFSQFRLATNGTDDVYGNFDPARVDRMVRIVTDIYRTRGTPIPGTVTADTVATNEFIDPTIGLGRPV